MSTPVESDDVIVVYITCPTDETSTTLARILIENRLAACVNIIPTVRSLYEWKGQLCDDQESLLIIKTVQPLFEQLQKTVKAHHPYEVAEIIALPVVAGAEDYITWVKASIAGQNG